MTLLLFLLGLASVALLVLAIVVVPTWLAQGAFAGVSGKPTQEEWALRVSDERRSVLWMIGGILAIIGLVYTALRHRLSQASHELQRDANRTDRYAGAIEQLGSEKLDIRLGGIYALERIALDSERDRGPIGEVLSAFVREHTREASLVPREQRGDVSTDVQAAITVLGRRPKDGTHPAANFSGACLPGADFSTMSFRNATFENADLGGARMQGADLSGAVLTRANLGKTNLLEADLSGAKLTAAEMVATNLKGAKLQEADLSNANLVGATLDLSDLTRAELAWAKLTRVSFVRATLKSANMRDANLKDINFSHADLRDADFRMATLEGVELSGANLTGSALTGDNLNYITITDHQLESARISKNAWWTKLVGRP
jgi:uncharacterized protein YjbI with pentapeptide repeats